MSGVYLLLTGLAALGCASLTLLRGYSTGERLLAFGASACVLGCNLACLWQP